MTKKRIYEARLRKDRGITLLRDLCERLGLKPGSPLLIAEDGGTVRITQDSDFARLFLADIVTREGR